MNAAPIPSKSAIIIAVSYLRAAEVEDATAVAEFLESLTSEPESDLPLKHFRFELSRDKDRVVYKTTAYSMDDLLARLKIEADPAWHVSMIKETAR